MHQHVDILTKHVEIQAQITTESLIAQHYLFVVYKLASHNATCLHEAHSIVNPETKVGTLSSYIRTF